MKSPHCVIELSSKTWQTLKDNSIHLEGMLTGKRNEKNVKWYSTYECGRNIKLCKKKGAGMPDNGSLKEIKISEMKKKFFIITCNKAEVIEEEVFIVDECAYNDENVNEKRSGVILLCICMHDHQKHTTGWEWGIGIYKTITASKNNVIKKKNNHHQSLGGFYSYGNRGNFGMVNGSSVGQYSHKKFKDDLKSMTSQIRDQAIECITCHEFASGVKTLATRVRNVKALISPIIDVAYLEQEKRGSINLKKTESAELGLWETTVAVNGHTLNFHVEEDASYTVVSVPNQCNDKKRNREYRFIFQLKQQVNICMTMKYGLVFMYSGKFLTHRQQCTNPCAPKEELFFNLVSYSNKRLYNHIKKSFDRK